MTPTKASLPGDPLSSFSRLSPCIYHLPAADAESVSNAAKSDGTSTDSDHSRQPDLIIFCAWMNAAPRHILKYTETYLSFCPSSSQLLITTSLADMSYRPNSAQRSRLAPVLGILLAAVEPMSATTPPTSPPNSAPTTIPRILLHVFSHGGAHTACQLAIAFQAHTDGRPLPVSALVLDSTPGHATYKRSLDAIIQSMPPSPLIRVPGTLLAHTFLVTKWVMGRVLGIENAVERLRAGLNDKQLFAAEAPRLYAYSKADRMVWWEDVEEHAKVAEDLGWEVERVRFEDSAHAGHVLEGGERYWDAVRRTWAKMGESFSPGTEF